MLLPETSVSTLQLHKQRVSPGRRVLKKSVKWNLSNCKILTFMFLFAALPSPSSRHLSTSMYPRVIRALSQCTLDFVYCTRKSGMCSNTLGYNYLQRMGSWHDSAVNVSVTAPWEIMTSFRKMTMCLTYLYGVLGSFYSKGIK